MDPSHSHAEPGSSPALPPPEPSEDWDALLCQASDALPAIIWTCGADGQSRAVSRRWLDFTGLTMEQARGHQWAQAIHPEDVEQFLAMRKAAIAAHMPFQAEYRVRRADGGYRWVLNQANPQFAAGGHLLGYAGQVIDITARKQAEDRLRPMSQAVEQSPASVVITDLNGNIEYVNSKFTALTGYSLEEAIGKNPRILKSGEMPVEAYRELWRTIQAGREWHGEFHNKKRNGELYWESVSICPVRDPTGKPTHYIAVKEDITERKRVEAALRESEERFRIAARNASDRIYEWDLHSDLVRVWAADGDPFQVHSFADWRRRIHPQDHKRVVDAIRQCVESGRPYQDEYRVMAPDGAVLYYADRASPLCDESGRPCRWIGVVSDITTRKQSEEIVSRLASIVQSSNDAILAMDRAFRVISWNPAAEKLFGYRQEEILGRSAMLLVRPQRVEEAGFLMATALRGEGVSSYDALSPRRDGSLCPVNLTLSPLINEVGKLIGFSAIIRDISEQQRAQEALRESENRFRALIQKSSDAVTLIDAAGAVLDDNGGLIRILGASSEPRIGQRMWEWVYPEDLPEARALLDDVLRHPASQPRAHLRLLHADGSLRSCDVVAANLLSEPGVRALVVNLRDVTRQAKVEEALRDSEQQYRKLVEDAVDVIFTFNLRGQLTSVNRAGERLTGYRRGQLLDMNIRQLAAPESWPPIEEAIVSRLGGGPDVVLELEIVARDGRRVPLEVTGGLLFEGGQPVGFQAIARDIRERKRSELQRRHQREVLEMVVQNEPLSVVMRRLVEMIEHYCPETTACISLAKAHCVANCPNRMQNAQAHGWNGGLCIPIRTGAGEQLGAVGMLCPARPIGESELVVLETKAKLASLALEHHQLTDRLAFQARHDPLTGLPNRSSLEDRLQHAITLARRQQKMVAIIYLDLDRFKLVNDTLGHALGDMLLQETARRLRAVVRESDTIARAAGDEFVAVCFGLDSAEAAEALGEQLVSAMRHPFHIRGHELFLSVSGGLSLFPRDGAEAGPLLKNADVAMYAAKDGGKNKFESYSPAMNSAAAELLEFEGCLHRALDRHELLLYYQPQFELRSGRLAGLEALLRWNHPQRGLVLPGSFVPLAEECGLIVPIGSWVIQEACRQHRAWRDAGYPPVKIAVNVSALQFAYSNLSAIVTAALRQYAVEPRYLELEITEGLLMRDVADSARQITALRDLGVRVAIDDFGTGYSSLSYLQKLPIDDLKIDQCFVKGISAADSTAPLVEAVIGLAHGLKLTATAEGVETPEQLEALRSLNCDKAQGYLLGRPAPPGQCETLLDQSRIPVLPVVAAGEWSETAPRA